MKIKNFKLFQLPPRRLFLKTETDEVPVGLSEAVVADKALIVKP